MRVKDSSESLHHTGTEVYCAADDSISDCLHSLGNFTKDPEFLSPIAEF